MTTLISEFVVPAEGTVNGRHIVGFATDAHAGYELVMYEGQEGLAQWTLSAGADAVQVAQELLHDDAERRLIKAGVIKRSVQ